MAEAEILYAISISIGLFWLYNVYKIYREKEKSFEDYYSKILNADEYKVKGKFEILR